MNDNNDSKLFQCKSISSQNHHGRHNSMFSQAKSGLVRLHKDGFKFSYVIELFQANKLTENDLKIINKPIDSFNIHKQTVTVQTGKEFIIIKFKPEGVIRLEFQNTNDKNEFELVLNRCLDDPDLLNDQISEETKQAIVTSLNEIKQEQTKTIIDDLNDLGKDDLKQNNKKTCVNNNLKYVNLIENNNTSSKPTTPALTSGISNKKFYSNSNNYNCKYDKENSDFITKPFKRRHSPSFYDENFPEANDENSCSTSSSNLINTNNNKFLSQISPITPKRNCLSQYGATPSSNGSYQKWNRNNSMGKTSGGKGFSNLGNTCYMNAILQCLLNIDLFSNDLLFTKQQLNDDLTQNCLYSSLCELYQVKELNNENIQIQALKEVKNAISQEATRFSGYQQHDAHEFLCQVLDQLKEDVDRLKKQNDINNKKENNKLLSSISTSTSLSSSSASSTTPTQQTTDDPLTIITNNNKINDNKLNLLINPVVENFEFEVSHSIQCTQCSELIIKREEFNNLCLELPSINTIHDQQISIQDALDIFFRDETVPFNCEKCKNNNVVIKHKFKRLPRILILYLKRYQFSDGNNLIKNDCSVNIPRYLTLNWLCDNEIELPKVQSLDVVQFVKTNILNNELKPIPLATKELNQQNRLQSITIPSSINTNQSVSSQKQTNVYSRVNLNTKPRRDIFDTKNIINDNGMSNISKINSAFFNDDNEPLPSLNEDNNAFKMSTSITTTNNDNNNNFDDIINIYDEKHFILKDMSEDEQFNLAMTRSLEEQQNYSYSIEPVSIETKKTSGLKVMNNNKNNNKLSNKNNDDVVQYLDGNFDMIYDGDENDTHVVNTKNNDEDDDENNYKPKRDMFGSRKHGIIRDYSARKKLDTKKKRTNELHYKNVDLITEKFKRSNSFQDTDIEEPFVSNVALEKENNKNQNNDEILKILNNNDIIKQYNVNNNEQILANDQQQQQQQQQQDENNLNLDRSESQKKIIEENSKNGKEPNSYRLIGIVSHLGHSSNSGHYICDVYNLKTKTWSSFDDRKVETLNEDDVLYKRSKTGYILFYIHNTMETNTEIL